MLVSERVTFKVAASPERVAELNQGAGGPTQAGKFVTAYPVDEDQAVRAASALDRATEGMRGPRVLGDRALSPASLVHYRYADFVLRMAEDAGAERDIEAPDRDPFVTAGLVPERKVKLVADRYLITANLHRSVRGAVHLAVDARERRTCILKRAWRDAGVMPDGTDARDRLRDEARILRELQPDPHFPEVWDLVEHDLDLFLVMQQVEGKTFAEIVHGMHAAGDPPGDDAIVRWGIEIASALERIHGRGLVHRDLNPVNVIVGDEGSIALIDFELVQRAGARPEGYGAGTPGYMSPGQAASDPARVIDDLYGLGALLFLAATGSDPSPESSEASDALAQVSSGLAAVISACLAFDDRRAPSAAAVKSDLERALRS